jgi:hypothetical protein
VELQDTLWFLEADVPDTRTAEEKAAAEAAKQRAPKLACTLYDLAQAGKAWFFQDATRACYLVIEGKYTGFWTYDRGSRRTIFRSHMVESEFVHMRHGKAKDTDKDEGVWEIEDGGNHLATIERKVEDRSLETLANKVLGIDDLTFHYTNRVRLALPSWCYGRATRAYEKHKKGSDTQAAWAVHVLRWKIFCTQSYDFFEARCHRIAIALNLNELRMSQLSYTYMLPLCVGLVPDELESELHRDKDALVHKLTWLGRHDWLVNSIGVRKRQRFVKRVLLHGPKYALRRSFPKAHRQTINSAMTQRWAGHAQLLSSWRCRADVETLMNAWHLCRTYGQELKPFVTKLAEKHGTEAMENYVHFRAELARAVGMGLDIRYPLQQVESASTYRRWHDHVAERIGRFMKAQNISRAEAVEKNYQHIWEGLAIPSGMRPLLTQADFENESERMSHCISSYFFQTEHIYAHIDLQNELGEIIDRGSVQINVGSNPRIVQIRGFGNQRVSPGLEMRVNQFIFEELRPKMEEMYERQ